MNYNEFERKRSRLKLRLYPNICRTAKDTRLKLLPVQMAFRLRLEVGIFIIIVIRITARADLVDVGE
jgi:hypothetical protein